MGDVVLSMHVSLDGFVASPDGGLDWIFPSFDDEYTELAVASLWRAGVHVMGGTTARGMAAYWPSPDIEPRDIPFARPMNEIPKVVFSSSLNALDWHATRIANRDVAAELEQLRRETRGEVLVHGGACFAQTVSSLQLVDRYDLVVQPVALGEGIPLFPPMPEPLLLTPIEVRRLRSGAVLYVSTPNKAKESYT